MIKLFMLGLILSLMTCSFAYAEERGTIVDHSVDGTRAIRIAPEEEHYIFDLDEDVTRTHVYYQNRFGIELAADLYMAKDADMSLKYPAIIVGPPYGGVKEQGPGVYANQLAKRGFVALAIDPAYHGYSGGSRPSESPITAQRKTCMNGRNL